MVKPISRRQAIQSGFAAVAAGHLHGALGAWLPPRLRSHVAPPSASTAGSAPVALPQPKVLKSANGELAVTLTARPGVVDMAVARPVTTYTYDNVVPGYTWEVDPGDTQNIDLVNKLPELAHPPAMAMDRPHEWTNTNLHTHGLHVSPAGIADNVFLDVPPGATQHYEIPLPADHPGGIFWLRTYGSHDPTDRYAAMRLLEEAREQQHFITGLIYVNGQRPNLAEHERLTSTPLAAFAPEQVRPSRESLDKIMAGMK